MTPVRPASAIVLAGGRASRFGGPKLAVLVGGIPLLHRSILAVAEVASEIVVVGGSGDVLDVPPTPVPMCLIHDSELAPGPLVALVAGLRAATSPTALVVGGDMPRLAPAVLGAMLGHLAPGGPSAVVLGAGGEMAVRQPLPMALETTSGSRLADELVARGRRSLQALLDALPVTVLSLDEWLRLDPDAGTLDDIDEPADLERLAMGLRDDPGEESANER
jgi:molybdopterin-guanine dinucleotide biosynthesis protein A